MKKSILLSLIVMLCFSAIVVAQTDETPEPAYDNQNSPVDLLASYYNAIERGEYERAYAYWENAPQTFNEFAAGFEDTLAIQLIVQPPTRMDGAAGSVYVQIPTVLFAGHTDGTLHTYSGCFVTRRSNIEPADTTTWHLYDATLTETDLNNIATMLSEACVTGE